MEHVLQDDRSLVECQILKEVSKGRAVDMNTLSKKKMGDEIDGL